MQKSEELCHKKIIENMSAFCFKRRSNNQQNTNYSKHILKRNIHGKKLLASVSVCSAGVIHYDFMKPGSSTHSRNILKPTGRNDAKT